MDFIQKLVPEAIVLERAKRILICVVIFFAIIVCVFGAYRLVYANKIFPGVKIGGLRVGGVSVEVATEKLSTRATVFNEHGLKLLIDGKETTIYPQNYGVDLLIEDTIQEAYDLGRAGPFLQQLYQSLSVPITGKSFQASIHVDNKILHDEIRSMSEIFDTPPKDIRLVVEDKSVEVLFDTQPGRVVDREAVKEAIIRSVQELDANSMTFEMTDVAPEIDSTSAEKAVEETERMMASPLVLTYRGYYYTVTESMIGSWIISGSDGGQLIPELDDREMSIYISELAEKINTPPQNPEVIMSEGKVVKFTPPVTGKVLEEDETIQLISDALTERMNKESDTSAISLPVITKAPVVDGSAAELGITELIGTATTSFAGSPTNRRANIKNGTRFLTGVLVAPDDEFSTVKALGKVDNTTGYLPELVIKGDRTVPEFGGGLCQVSTTLFRSILNAGLPITARRNHSYRAKHIELAITKRTLEVITLGLG